MPTVSILVPAYKPDYLAKTLASACAQSFVDTEILVGDDTPDAKLRDIVCGIGDPRIRYFHHGFKDGLRNQEQLWANASGKFVKWLYDDDLLLPGSVAALVAALERYPQATLAFHERIVIGPDERIIAIPDSLLAAGHTAFVDRALLVEKMVASTNNFVGEPSNVMLVRDRVDVASMMTYRSRKLAYLTDVAMYLNMAEQGPLLLVGGYHGCFRRHPNQNSNAANPEIAAGFYEWEIMIRGEAAAGNLDAALLAQASAQLERLYPVAIERLGVPEVALLRDNLCEFAQLPAVELPESPQFHDRIAQVRASRHASIQAAL